MAFLADCRGDHETEDSATAAAPRRSMSRRVPEKAIGMLSRRADPEPHSSSERRHV
jgi:hypothetical protein